MSLEQPAGTHSRVVSPPFCRRHTHSPSQVVPATVDLLALGIKNLRSLNNRRVAQDDVLETNQTSWTGISPSVRKQQQKKKSRRNDM